VSALRHLLALDHPMSVGWIPGQDTISTITARADSLSLDAVVAHRGHVRCISAGRGETATILQLCGSTTGNRAKEVLIEPTEALETACVAVAVEVSTSADARYIRDVMRAIHAAHSHGLPVLTMASYDPEECEQGALNAILLAQCVDSDCIKLSVPEPRDSGARLALKQLVADSPPLLMAGGPSTDPLGPKVDTALELGFWGTCIGRHYFHADGATATRQLVNRFNGPR
jgi:DhnA family fructose-bisphosphate aldolase class Ia